MVRMQPLCYFDHCSTFAWIGVNMTDPASAHSFPSNLIGDIETEIDGLQERATQCRKAMFVSKIAIIVGAGLVLALFLGIVQYHTTLFTVGVASFLGGVVWFGANRSTLMLLEARIKSLNARRIELIDSLHLRTIE